LLFAGYSPPSSTHSRAAARFGELVQQATDGRIRVHLVWNILDFGYPAEGLIDLVTGGLLDGMYYSTTSLFDIAPKFGLLDLPFLLESRDHVFRMLDGPIGAELSAELEARTPLAVLGYWENGFRHLSNRLRPIRTPADMHSLRIRIQPNPIYAEAFRALGAEPVATDIAELIPALEAGRIDGQENPLDNTWTYGAYRFTPYITLTAQFFGVRVMCVRRGWLESLSAEDREAVYIAARQAIAYQRQLAVERDAEMTALLTAHGVQIEAIPDETRAAFRRASEPVYDRLREQIGSDLIERVLQA
jgi:tripartite ATP-independent transporter DctP family solute receptor